jgi:hypothetical protein
MKIAENQLRKIVRESLQSHARRTLSEIYTDEELGSKGEYDPRKLYDPESLELLRRAGTDFAASLAMLFAETWLYFRTGQEFIDAIRATTGVDLTPDSQKEWRSQIAAASLHDFLDRFSIAGLGVADIVSGFLYMGEKRWGMAALCMLAAIPVVGAGISRARRTGKFALRASEVAALDAGIQDIKQGLRASGVNGADNVISEIDKVRAEMNGGKADFADYVGMPQEMRSASEDVAQNLDQLEGSYDAVKKRLSLEKTPDIVQRDVAPSSAVDGNPSLSAQKANKLISAGKVFNLDDPVTVVHRTHAEDITIADLDAEVARAGRQSRGGKLKTAGLYTYEASQAGTFAQYGANKIDIVIPRGAKILDVSGEQGITSRLTADTIESLRDQGIVAIKGRDFKGPPEWVIIDNSVLRQNADFATQASRAADTVGTGNFSKDWSSLGFESAPGAGGKAYVHPNYPGVVFKPGKGFSEIEIAEKYPEIMTRGQRSVDTQGRKVAVMERVRPLHTISQDELFNAIRKDFPEIPEAQVRSLLPAPGDGMGDEFMEYFMYPMTLRSAKTEKEVLDMILKYNHAKKQWQIIPGIEKYIETLRLLRNNRKFSEIARMARNENAYFQDLFRLDNMGLDASGEIKILDFDSGDDIFLGDVSSPPRRASGPPPVDDPTVKRYVDEILSITQGLNEGIIGRWKVLAGVHSRRSIA